MEQQQRFLGKDIKLRVSDELHARLKKISDMNSQPMASQIRVYINDGLRRDEAIAGGETGIASEEKISHKQSSKRDN